MSGSTMEATVKRYLEYEKIEQHRHHIERLVKDNDGAQLERLLAHRLTFGTAGLRGRMGPGYSQMNELVVIQTSQGLASYLLECFGEQACQESGVIIGHDARHNSSRFAQLAALAFLQRSIPVYLCDQIIATPMVALGVRHYTCLAGIMVTASHNPKDDNGYKVFWSNGAQILSPHDKNIQAHIERPENLAPWPQAWNHELLDAASAPWCQILYQIQSGLTKTYMEYLERSIVGSRRQLNESSPIRLVYTSMHGVGHSYLTSALRLAGFGDRAQPVARQQQPDPDFPTVRFPNPEESGALDLAFEAAQASGSQLILAIDPDADRCAAALYEPASKRRRVLTGNEIGALLGWWLWHCHQERQQQLEQQQSQPGTTNPQGPEDPTDEEPPAEVATGLANVIRGLRAATGASRSVVPGDCCMLSTAVSSKFLSSMARVEGFEFVETLTGFKYMGNRAEQLMKANDRCVLFAYEEAIGYMVDPQILDKDGISAALQLAQCAAHLAVRESRTLEQQLDWLHEQYGYHYSLNSYYLCLEQSTIRTIFHRLQEDFPSSFVHETTSEGRTDRDQFRVTRIRDLNSGFDSGTATKRPDLPVSTSSFMVTFFVENNMTLTIRTSGTEPKIKYYSEIIVQLPKSAADQQRVKLEAQARLRRLVDAALERCLKPKLYNLQPAGQ